MILATQFTIRTQFIGLCVYMIEPITRGNIGMILVITSCYYDKCYNSLYY